MKEQESKELLSNLGIKTSLNKTPLLGNILLWVYKMNKITEEFLLGDKFMPAMHLKQLGFTYSAWKTYANRRFYLQKWCQ